MMTISPTDTVRTAVAAAGAGTLHDAGVSIAV